MDEKRTGASGLEQGQEEEWLGLAQGKGWQRGREEGLLVSAVSGDESKG